MVEHGLFNKLQWLNAFTLKTQLTSMLNNVMDAQKKLVQVQSLKELQDSKKNPKIPNIGNVDNIGSLSYKAKGQKNAEKQSSIVKQIARDIASRSVKRTSTVKYTKKIK
jgi:hypothetical protein